MCLVGGNLTLDSYCIRQCRSTPCGSLISWASPTSLCYLSPNWSCSCLALLLFDVQRVHGEVVVGVNAKLCRDLPAQARQRCTCIWGGGGGAFLSKLTNDLLIHIFTNSNNAPRTQRLPTSCQCGTIFVHREGRTVVSWQQHRPQPLHDSLLAAATCCTLLRCATLSPTASAVKGNNSQRTSIDLRATSSALKSPCPERARAAAANTTGMGVGEWR